MNTFDAQDRLVECLRRLPGLGRRSAERIAVRLVRNRDGLLKELASALNEAGRSLCVCSRCGSVTSVDRQPCQMCSSGSRDGSVLCVVEEPDDIALIERSGGYNGRYHALMGKLSPMRGSGPGNMRVDSLVERVKSENISEVILALSTDMEGDATAGYITEKLKGLKVRVSRLPMGLPAGSGIMYSDPVTIGKAIKGRIIESSGG